MLFNFNFSNDFGEAADVCVRCGKPLYERCNWKGPGVRLTLWACPECRYLLSSIFGVLVEEFLLRSVFATRDAREAGEPVASYSSSFNFDWNGRPATKTNKKPKRHGLAS